MTNIILLWQMFCHGKHTFVVTKDVFSWQKWYLWQLPQWYWCRVIRHGFGMGERLNWAIVFVQFNNHVHACWVGRFRGRHRLIQPLFGQFHIIRDGIIRPAWWLNYFGHSIPVTGWSLKPRGHPSAPLILRLLWAKGWLECGLGDFFFFFFLAELNISGNHEWTHCLHGSPGFVLKLCESVLAFRG